MSTTNPELLKMPLARDGEKNTLPETTGATTGEFSQQYGFQQINSTPLTAGGKAPDRKDINGVFNLLGGVAFMAQKGFTFNWDSTQDYYVGCVVIDATDGLRYECIADVTANSTAPSADTTHWQIFKAGTDIDYWFRQKSTVYTAGDLRCTESLPYGWYLECTVAGTTDSGDITLPSPVVENAIVVDGTVTWEIRKIADTQGLATKANITGSNLAYHKDVITTSGTYTAPVTGLYRITVKGGGGSGATGKFTSSSVYNGGSGGGEGGTAVAYEHITAGDSIPIVIGAGGVGTFWQSGDGAQDDGGNTTVTINGNTYTGGGGKGGGAGGTGMINGAPGNLGLFLYNVQATAFGGSGGGAGGGLHTTDGTNGGGGGGGSISFQGYANPAGDGGDGYVWFEYYTPGA
jgi:hypothetical protein